MRQLIAFAAILKMPTARRFVAAALLVIGTATASPAADLLDPLKANHPRLLVTDSTWTDIQARRRQDPALDRFVARLIADGYATLDRPPLKYEKEGKRLLAVSRSAFQRVVLWSFDYEMTRDVRFLHRADQEMLALSAFPDWNPDHFLDTAEMTAALALGFDWLYSDLSPASREVIRQAIAEKGLRPGRDARFTAWHHNENNWNQVCFGGLTLGALAVGDTVPQVAGPLLESARKNIHNGLKPYAPDGVYPEGPTYWAYGTTYQVMMIAALQSALGTDWDLSGSPGLLPSADYFLEMTGPTRLLFDYSDGSAKEEYALEPALFWMAGKLGQPGLLYFQRDRLEELQTRTKIDASLQFLPLAAIFWPADGRFASPGLPLAWFGRGTNPVAAMRSSWTDSNALYLAVKGGTASANHAHMDAGSFVFDADGVRWAEDLGAQNYNSLESKGVDLWGMGQKSSRWTIFRLNNFSHNTLTINGRLHNVKGFAPITAFSTNLPAPAVVVDLTCVFDGQASQVIRQFQLLPDRTMSVEDSLRGLQPGDDVRWAMVTSASVKLFNQRAMLAQNGKHLEFFVVAPPDATLAVVSGQGRNHGIDAPNPNTRIVTVNAKAPPSGVLKIAVRLRPE